MIKEPTKLVITYSSPISDGELRKMVEAVEDTQTSIETRQVVKQVCFTNTYLHDTVRAELFDVLTSMAIAWEKRGKNSGRWVDTVRCN